MNIKIAVCDDEIKHAEKICGILQNFSVETFTNPVEFLEKLLQGEKYDVIFLDIVMPDMDGITLARKIREIDEDVIIVFITSKIDFIQTGYEVKAFRYILKEQLPDGINKIWTDIETELAVKKDVFFTYEFERETYSYKCGEIIYFESNLRRVTIHTNHTKNNNSVIFYGKLDDIENKYPLFIRIHKSYLVNRKHIRRISSESVLLSNGEILPVSRRYGKDIIKYGGGQ